MTTLPPSSDLTNGSLFIRLNQNGPQREMAWAEFHSLYAPIIANFGRRMGAKPQDLEDMIQEVIKGFFRVSPQFVYNPTAGRFRSYLRACVVNTLAEMQRKRGRDVATNLQIEKADPGDVAIEKIWDDVWETDRLSRAIAVVRQRYAVNADRQRTFPGV